MIEKIKNWLINRVSMSSFQEFLRGSLVEFCSIESIPTSDLNITVHNEQEAFNFIDKVMSEYCPKSIPDTMPINHDIYKHDSYTRPYYTDNSNAYNNRKNMVYIWNADNEKVKGKGKAVGLNAHIDTVPPHIAPFIKGNIVYGRGTCDDKGGCLNIIAALRLLDEIVDEFGISPGRKISSMFVIDEETGGNGSLSLAMDDELMKTIDTMIVVEPTSQQIHPANRGALWYRVELAANSGSRAIGALLKVVLSLEDSGRKLRSESSHDLFPDRPVQICQGIFGPYGEHPSRICDRIEFDINSSLSIEEIDKLASKGIEEYIRVYGKRTPDIPAYSLKLEQKNFLLEVQGSSGHMGASLELDNAIVKAAYIIESILSVDKDLRISFPGLTNSQIIILEGGQGFLPGHTLNDVKKIIEDSVLSSVSEMADSKSIRVNVNFDKLHNDSFSGDPLSESVSIAAFSAKKVGVTVRKPLVGFPVSCDARLFANISGKETLTVGSGKLEAAHSSREKMDLNELALSSAFLALYILIQTGSLETADYS